MQLLCEASAVDHSSDFAWRAIERACMVILHEARVNADTRMFRTSSGELHYLCNTGALRNRQSRIHLGKSVERAMFPGVLCLSVVVASTTFGCRSGKFR